MLALYLLCCIAATSSIPVVKRHNSIMILHADMFLSKRQSYLLYGNAMVGSPQKRAASERIADRWPNGLIPYDITDSDFTSVERSRIERVFKHVMDKTCIKFRPRNSTDKSYINLKAGNGGCTSHVGMLGGEQPVYLSKMCRFFGSILHEIGHVIGLVHEHQLPDRDTYIKINWKNIHPSSKMWFNKYLPSSVRRYGQSYDISSVMHYGTTAYSVDGQKLTIEAKNPIDTWKIEDVWTKGSLSTGDVYVIRKLYDCDGNTYNEDEDNLLPVKFCQDSHPLCEYWEGIGECENNPGYMRTHCQVSCSTCPTK